MQAAARGAIVFTTARESKTLLKPVLLSCCLAALGLSAAQADTLDLPAAPAAASASMPVKGQTMKRVVKRFGEPDKRYPAVGGDTPRHPPITRWDYAGYSVFFEHSHVIDTVVPGQPPEVVHTEELQPAP